MSVDDLLTILWNTPSNAPVYLEQADARSVTTVAHLKKALEAVTDDSTEIVLYDYGNVFNIASASVEQYGDKTFFVLIQVDCIVQEPVEDGPYSDLEVDPDII